MTTTEQVANQRSETGPPGVKRRIAELDRGVADQDLPGDVIERATQCVCDWLGGALLALAAAPEQERLA